MSGPSGRLAVAPADVAQFLFAFGLVPLVLARDFVRNVPPWSFGLTPRWSAEQLGFFLLAGAVLGLISNRPATGLAWVAIGVVSQCERRPPANNWSADDRSLPAQRSRRGQSSTTPVEPFTTTGAPSGMTFVASRAPSTSGMPNSRATIAA